MLYIRVKNGQAFEHPILETNFKQAFPGADADNLPPGIALFERVEAPALGPYEKNQRVQYELGEDGVYRDVWYCDTMSSEEVEATQAAVKAGWSEINGYASWFFDEATCSFQPPVPFPVNRELYSWNEDTRSWQADMTKTHSLL